MQKKTRDYSGDFLRILLIIMIIVHHALVHGLGLNELKSGINIIKLPPYYFLLNSFCVMAVNAFFFVSGFYGINRNFKKILKLYAMCVWYAFIWNLVSLITGNEFSLYNMINVVFPIRDYWFMAVYFIIALLAPYIEIMYKHLKNKQRIFVILVLTSVNIIYGFVFNFVGVGDGYTLFQGFNLYIVGLFCSYNTEFFVKKRKLFGLLVISCAFLEFAMTYFTYQKGMLNRAWHLFAYNNPIVIIMAVSFCVLFFNRGWKENRVTAIITKISTCSLAAYLMTDNMYAKKIVFNPLIKILYLNKSSIISVFEILVYSVILVIICVIIEIVRDTFIKFVYGGMKR